MALLTGLLRRQTAILKMPDAIARGLSPTAFINELRLSTGSYRKTLFLSDWRTSAGIEAKKDLVKYIRKDRLPSPRVMPDVTWSYSKEYIYKLNTWSRINPDDELNYRMITFQADSPMTVAEVEAHIFATWKDYERYAPEGLEKVSIEAVYHRIPSEFEGE